MSRRDVEVLSLPLEGTTMDCVRFGGGDRQLALISGLNLRSIRERAYALARMYRIFAQDYTVYIFDRREEVPPGYSVPDMAADTARAMDGLGLRQADVLGISQGGMIAQYLALERPELVDRLVLAVTLSRPNETIRQATDRWAELAERDDYAGLVRDVMARMYSDTFLEKFGRLLPAVSGATRPPSLARFAVLTRACVTCDTYDRLEDIRCPVLVIGGRQDRVVTGRASEEIAKKLGCALYMYQDLGHSAYEEARDFNDRVLAFLQS